MSNISLFRDITDVIRLVVVGIGGAGGNVVARTHSSGLNGVEFVALNTDKQALDRLDVPQKILIGENFAHGLGAGGNPEFGAKAMEESREVVSDILKGSHMAFIVAGLGGGTGTGAAPIVAEMAKEHNVLTVAIITLPFNVEGRKRKEYAEQGVEKLREFVDTILIIQNQKLLSVIDKSTSVDQAFEMVDKHLHNALKGVYDLIIKPGIINHDFADIKNVIAGSGGEALIGVGVGDGENAAMEAVQKAINNPLLEDTSIEGARRGLLNFTINPNYSFLDIEAAANFVKERGGFEETFSFGIVKEENLKDNEVIATIIATGFDSRVKKVRDREIRLSVDKMMEVQPPTKMLSYPVEEPNTPVTPITETQKFPNNQINDIPTSAEKKDNAFADSIFKPIASDDFEIPTYLRRKSGENK